MLAAPGEAALVDERLAYEPKHDGIRALVALAPGRANPVRIWSRLGNDKTAQFPELVASPRASRSASSPSTSFATGPTISARCR